MTKEPDSTLDALRKGLALAPDQIKTNLVTPVFVPSSFFSLGNWVGPYLELRAKEIGLTWSVMLPNQTMRYVDRDLAQYWEQSGLDWKRIALRNLSEHSNQNPGTHEFRRANGERYAVAMMHEDGIGPSRLLLRDQLSHVFPNGYRVALPEMSCALAFMRDLEPSEFAQIRELIDRCFEKGTRPLAPGIYDPDDLLPVANKLNFSTSG